MTQDKTEDPAGIDLSGKVAVVTGAPADWTALTGYFADRDPDRMFSSVGLLEN